MMARGLRTSLGTWLLAAALPLATGTAVAAEVQAIRVHTGPTGTRAELQLDADAEFRVLYLADPDRLVLDLPGSRVARSLPLPAGAGLVKAVRAGQPEPGVSRIVFDMHSAVTALRPRLEPGSAGPQLVLEWPDDGASPEMRAPAPVAAAQSPAPAADPASNVASGPAPAPTSIDGLISTVVPAPAPSTSAAPPATAVEPAAPATQAVAPAASQPPVRTVQDVAKRAGMRPLVIAIDAGHGGQDPGAIGATGTREKDITLQVAKELARQVNATPGLKAYLTRDADFFIPLAQRYQKARAAKADLFVSIHADAFTNPKASGSSVFVLSQRGASSQAAKWLASQENSADLVGGVKLQDKDDTLASVLLDLSQSATMKASEDMAAHVLDGLKALGKTHKPNVERANFVVLRSPDVPSMLVETAFITNPDEERRLRDPKHQQRLARAILNGVTRYFTQQPPPGTLYAARAEAERVGRTTGGSP